ncbi:hypothetical protein [Mycolicibacterium komossense]|uniref:Uncharacterized protein n=1 Tax=Mycolicibacterium komossense TaxID=1779 RepID=A0ABT3C8Y8_9MYCO|nr:hypothetical protein [Mycolicibacterium komossense]MCV7225918.1 hypothetical protein [Mycolicibacterium komossense]
MRNLDRRWLVAIVIAVVAVGVLAYQLFFNRPPEDCKAVKDLLDFNNSQGQIIAKKTGDGALPLADYQLWADGMTQRAEQVTSADLSPHAIRLAELATQFVTKLPQVQNPAPGQKAPPAAYEMAALNDQITSETKTLTDKCSG